MTSTHDRDALRATLAGARALTVRQPWAWAISHGRKSIENRSVLWTFRGPLLIHAGAGWSNRGAADPRVRAAWPFDDVYAGAYVPHSGPTSPPRSAIVAVSDLVDVHHAGACTDEGGACHPWGETSYPEAGGRTRTQVSHLVLADVVPLPDPVPCSGALGLWTPPDHLVDDVVESLLR